MDCREVAPIMTTTTQNHSREVQRGFWIPVGHLLSSILRDCLRLDLDFHDGQRDEFGFPWCWS